MFHVPQRVRHVQLSNVLISEDHRRRVRRTFAMVNRHSFRYDRYHFSDFKDQLNRFRLRFFFCTIRRIRSSILRLFDEVCGTRANLCLRNLTIVHDGLKEAMRRQHAGFRRNKIERDLRCRFVTCPICVSVDSSRSGFAVFRVCYLFYSTSYLVYSSRVRLSAKVSSASFSRKDFDMCGTTFDLQV